MDNETGKMVIKTDDEMGGKAETYWWGQNEKEITIKAIVPDGTKSKMVQMNAYSQKLKLAIGGQTICEGALLRPIIADESMFILEDTPEGRLLTLTLLKATPTKGQ